MPIRFRCQDCRSRVKVPEGSQGKQVKCPRCGRIQSVPKHHASQSAANQDEALTVHTCVGSIHRAPKRKEALVGAGVGSDRQDFAGGGVPGGLDIPDQTHERFEEPRNGNGKPTQRLSRKERRRMAAEAREKQRERDEMTAREEADREEQVIAESRRQAENLFATSKNRDYAREEAEAIDRPDIAPAPAAPQPIAFVGARQATAPAPDHDTEPAEQRDPAWSFDLTSEAYPFLRIIPWVLRVTALMLIGPAFKLMLVADAQGFSGVVSMLILFAGLAMVVVTWTVGEIATAVRDIALRKATG